MPGNKNAALFRALSNDADALACAVAQNRFPVFLRPIAERRRVTSVEFRPLLVDAMLTTHPRGFRILFNSNEANPTELQEQYEREDGDRMLTPRLRFSLAHELAHTFFYELNEGTPKVAKQFRSGGGHSSLENLERSCNKLASHLLLPTSMLEAELRSMKTICPESVLELAQRSGVSVEVLVRRLGDNSSFLVGRYFRGCIVLVKQSHNETMVSAIAKPRHLNIATDLRLMRPGERWQLCNGDGSQIHPASLSAVSFLNLSVATQLATSNHNYQVAVMEVSRFGSSVSYLLTFEEMEPTELKLAPRRP